MKTKDIIIEHFCNNIGRITKIEKKNKKYQYILDYEKYFGDYVLKVKLVNKNQAYINFNDEIIVEYPYIIGMKKYLGKDVLCVELHNGNLAFIDNLNNKLLECNDIEEEEDYYIISLNNEKYKIEKYD